MGTTTKSQFLPAPCANLCAYSRCTIIFRHLQNSQCRSNVVSIARIALFNLIITKKKTTVYQINYQNCDNQNTNRWGKKPERLSETRQQNLLARIRFKCAEEISTQTRTKMCDIDCNCPEIRKNEKCAMSPWAIFLSFTVFILAIRSHRNEKKIHTRKAHTRIRTHKIQHSTVRLLIVSKFVSVVIVL